MPLVYIRPLGGGLAYVHSLDGGGPTDPGFGVGGIPGIDNTLPGGGGHPWLPGHGGGGRPDNSLPWVPGHPANPLPPGGNIDNTLPKPPPKLKPGYTLVLVRGQDGLWHYAALAPGSAPPKPLPEPTPPPTNKPIDPDAPPPPEAVLPPMPTPT